MAEAEPLPSELAACPPAALEAYVQRRIRQFNSLPELRQHLGDHAATSLETATLALLATGGGGPAAQAGRAPPSAGPAELALVFRHDCRHVSCADVHCLLCAQSQNRRCPRTFSPKYLAGDVLKAGCGATLRVELVDKYSGRLVELQEPLKLQLCVVDGRQCEALTAGGAAVPPSDLSQAMLLLNQQKQPLLTSKQAGSDGEGKVLLELSKGCAVLQDLVVTGSSEALLSGQRPPFALWCCVATGDGQAHSKIASAVSEGFVVATPRVRSASKRDIPKLSDHVSKLVNVGNATQAKLRDLNRAALEARMQDELQLPMASAMTVGEFKQLVEWAQQEAVRCDLVKKMLKLTRGWEEARDHALKAVADDSRLRAFFTDSSQAAGLLIASAEGVPQLDRPLAVLHKATDGGGQPTLRATLLPKPEGQHTDGAAAAEQAEDSPQAAQRQGDEVDMRHVQGMLQHAQACWARRGHPGWALLQMDTPAFQLACSHHQQVLLPPQVAAAATPFTPHTSGAGPPGTCHALPALPALLPAAFAAGPAVLPPPPPPGQLPGSAQGSPRTPTGQVQLRMLQEFASLGVQPQMQGHLHPEAAPLPGPSPFEELLPSPTTAAAPGKGLQATQRSLQPPAVCESLTVRLLRSLGGPAPPQAMMQQADGTVDGRGSLDGRCSGGNGAGGGRSAAVPLHLQLLSSGESSSGQVELGGLGSGDPSVLPAPAQAPEALARPGVQLGLAGVEGAGVSAAQGVEQGIAPLPSDAQPRLSPARRLTRMPSISLFGTPLNWNAVAEMDAATGAVAAADGVAGQGDRQVSRVQSLHDMMRGAEAGPPVDWEELLRDAYRSDGSGEARLPLVELGASGGACDPSPSALLRMLSHASAAQEFGTGSFSGDWETPESLLGLMPADQLLQPAAAQAGAAGLECGASPDRKRQTLRLLTPEWTKRLSLSAADWAALLQIQPGPQQQQQVNEQLGLASEEGPLAAPTPLPASGPAGIGTVIAHESTGVVGAQLGWSSFAQLPPGAAKGERKRILSPCVSGLQGE